ncbi:MAG TPA: IPT/TIG domain-containing protein [Anaeromyxobacter sp.]|nr:IPT/TIG domain-containing protein [Anaeromyxobacter sp.]
MPIRRLRAVAVVVAVLSQQGCSSSSSPDPCVPQTCATLGADCGAAADGCGGTLECGSSCAAPEDTCGGGGAPNVCGCTRVTCAAFGVNCGEVADGCGGTLPCGPCTAPQTCGGGGVANVCGCTPTTCVALGANCGAPPDGCGGTLSCGTCADPLVCGGSAPFVCGGGACVPTTCLAEGKNCGTLSDGCSSTLECGSCTGFQTCGGGGAANVCGCTPATCGALGASCGSVADGCGGTLSCGSCTAPQTCGGGGVTNVCGCTPVTCEAAGRACGAAPDGCGGTLDCGACAGGSFCVAGACLPPGIVALEPAAGSTGVPVLLRGAGFGDVAGSVTVGGRAAVVDRWSPDEIVIFVVDDYAPGDHAVVVTPSGGSALAAASYRVLPWIRSVDPRVAASERALLTVTGDGFGAGTGSAFVGGAPATVDAWTNTSVQLRVPAGVTAGQQRVHVVTAGGAASNRYHVTRPGPDLWVPNRAPAQRKGHGAVWTGTEMLVWGGSAVFNFWNDGARYNPASDTVAPISTDGAPSARAGASIVWTGSEMVVWGGGTSTVSQDGARYDPVTDAWTPMTTVGAPVARSYAAAVWTGSEVLVWGGYLGNSKGTGSGARYDPANDRWTAIASTGAPTARWAHAAVWTGKELVVWGGDDGTSVLATGARYDPATDTWRPISTVGAPAARRGHTFVWTGSEVVVWGGNDRTAVLDTGARYDPVTDRWLPVATASAPSARWGHSMVWTGKDVLVFGGTTHLHAYSFYETQTGGRWNAETNTWSALPTGGAPLARYGHSAVWTGADLVVFGGETAAPVTYQYLDTGGAFRPSSGAWRTIMSANVLPDARPGGAVAWTGSELFVFGGRGWSFVGDVQFERGDGVRYDPMTDVWRALPTTGAPSPRAGAKAVWTGSEVIVWGGYTGTGASTTYLGTGGRYLPASNTWATLSSAGSPPAGRSGHSAVWTGSKLIVWGGQNGAGYLGSGAVYDPAAQRWAATSLTGAPSPRSRHSTVWTGTEMIVWGGYVSSLASGKLGDGARYDPATDTWTPLAATGAPAPRYDHGAAWTGTRMVLWGGRGTSSDLADGAIYDVGADAWTAIPASAALSKRANTGAVAAGGRVVFWGGASSDVSSTYGNGATFDPATGGWSAVAGAGAPVGRYLHDAVWTGDAMIVFGGYNSREGTWLGRGGVYRP